MQYLSWFNKKPWYYCQKAKNKPKNGTIQKKSLKLKQEHTLA